MSNKVNKEGSEYYRKKLSKQTIYRAPKSTNESGCMIALKPVQGNSRTESRWSTAKKIGPRFRLWITVVTLWSSWSSTVQTDNELPPSHTDKLSEQLIT